MFEQFIILYDCKRSFLSEMIVSLIDEEKKRTQHKIIFLCSPLIL